MMFFLRLVQIASNTSKGFAVKVGKVAPVPMEDNETTFPQLKSRIEATIKVLESVDVRFHLFPFLSYTHYPLTTFKVHHLLLYYHLGQSYSIPLSSSENRPAS